MADSRGPVAVRFGANLRAVRARAGISQDTLAERALLHRTEVGLLERGERMPRIDTLIVLGACLSVPPAELLRGIEWERPKVSATARFDGGAVSARQRGFRVSGRSRSST
jgi:transcriptional regulator with XRE-family HTH domain